MPPAEAYALVEVHEGVWSVRVPRPSGGDPARLYALRCTDGYVLVDAGWATPARLDPLASTLARAGIAIADVVGIALTHLHIDHCGLAADVRRESGAWIAAHPAEVSSARYRHGARSPFVADLEHWLAAVGVPEEDAAALLGARDASNAAAPIFDVDVLLGDGDPVDVSGWTLTALHTPGHSPGHLCFHDSQRNLLFAGDLLLEGHVPPIWSYDEGDGDDPIGAFFASIERIARLDGARVLPGHGAPFGDGAAVAARLRAHHEKRMAWLADHIARDASTLWEAALAAPWSREWKDLPPLLRLLALGKINAHVIALERRGAIRRTADAPPRLVTTAPRATAART